MGVFFLLIGVFWFVRSIPQVAEDFYAYASISSMGMTLSGDYWRSFVYGVDKVVTTKPFASTTISYYKCKYSVTVDNCEKQDLSNEMYAMQVPPFSVYKGEEEISGVKCDHYNANLDWLPFAIDMNFWIWNDTSQNISIVRRFHVKIDTGIFPVEIQMDYDKVKVIKWTDDDIVDTFCTKDDVCHDVAPHTLKQLQECDHDIFPPVEDKFAVFVLDVSGSMATKQKTKEGEKTRILVLQESMEKILAGLNSKQSFNIALFSSGTTMWQDQPVFATSENIKAATDFVNKATAGGSTNALDALKKGLTQNNVEALYFLSDGEPDQPASQILQMVKDTEDSLPNPVKVHTTNFFGTGAAAQFMKDLASLTGGVYTEIQEGQI